MWFVLAQTVTRHDKQQKFGELTINVALAFLALGVLLWVVLKIRARMSENDDATVSDHDLLSQYRDLHQQGELTDEEFRSIKSQIIARLAAGQNPISPPSATPQTLVNSPAVDTIERGSVIPQEELSSPGGETFSPTRVEERLPKPVPMAEGKPTEETLSEGRTSGESA